jgi:hypothetical protein
LRLKSQPGDGQSSGEVRLLPVASPPAHRSYDGNIDNFFCGEPARVVDIFIIERAIPIEFFYSKKVFERNTPVTKQHTNPTILRAGNAAVSRRLLAEALRR